MEQSTNKEVTAPHASGNGSLIISIKRCLDHENQVWWECSDLSSEVPLIG